MSSFLWPLYKLRFNHTKTIQTTFHFEAIWWKNERSLNLGSKKSENVVKLLSWFNLITFNLTIQTPLIQRDKRKFWRTMTKRPPINIVTSARVLMLNKCKRQFDSIFRLLILRTNVPMNQTFKSVFSIHFPFQRRVENLLASEKL